MGDTLRGKLWNIAYSKLGHVDFNNFVYCAQIVVALRKNKQSALLEFGASTIQDTSCWMQLRFPCASCAFHNLYLKIFYFIFLVYEDRTLTVRKPNQEIITNKYALRIASTRGLNPPFLPIYLGMSGTPSWQFWVIHKDLRSRNQGSSTASMKLSNTTMWLWGSLTIFIQIYILTQPSPHGISQIASPTK